MRTLKPFLATVHACSFCELKQNVRLTLKCGQMRAHVRARAHEGVYANRLRLIGSNSTLQGALWLLQASTDRCVRGCTVLVCLDDHIPLAQHKGVKPSFLYPSSARLFSRQER